MALDNVSRLQKVYNLLQSDEDHHPSGEARNKGGTKGQRPQ